MRYSRKDLLQLKDYHLEIDDKLTFDGDISTICPRIRAINEIYVKNVKVNLVSKDAKPIERYNYE